MRHVTSQLHRRTDIFDDVICRCTRAINSRDAHFSQTRHILIWHDASNENLHTILPIGFKQFHNARRQCHMRAGKDGETYYIHIFLQGGLRDHFWCLPQTCINNFHTSIPQGTCNNLGAPVMSIQPGLGNENTNFLFGHEFLNWLILLSLYLMKEVQKPYLTFSLIRNDTEISSIYMRVRSHLKYAILYPCKRDLIGLSGLTHYVA